MMMAETGKLGATVLKWAGGITALLSLLFALQQLTQLISDTRERKRSTAELYDTGKLQQSAADYAAAWSSFEQGLSAAQPGGQLAKLTGQLDKERRDLRAAQEDLAMEWLQNIRVSLTAGESFTDAVAPLAPVLTRGITAASGSRKADLLAHFGWANFLRWREGRRELNPETQYQQALQIDSLNPYAHANLGHWLLWTRSERALPEAKAHFATALRAKRARIDVRSKQVAAIEGLGTDGEPEYIRVLADMRRQNEPVGARTRSRLWAAYWSVCRPRYSGSQVDPAPFQAIHGAIPIEEHVAIFQTLFSGDEFDRWRARERDACLATLLEASGRRSEALRLWTAVREVDSSDATWRERANQAIKRLTPGSA
jgi:hypothetical protein